MKLEEYVYESWSPEGKQVFPNTLEISRELIQEFRELYKLTEQLGQECGYILFFDGKDSPIRHDPVVYGQATSMSIPKSNSYYNFGNIHAHPSEKIGHAGGHSAYSMQDLLTFENTTDRKLFIQFVVSCPKLYGMVYRMECSTFDGETKKFANTKGDEIHKESRNYIIEKKFRKPEEFVEKWMSLNNQAEADQWMDQLKRQTPDFGKKMEELSVASCKGFARGFGYGFYIGKTEGFGAGKLHLQK